MIEIRECILEDYIAIYELNKNEMGYDYPLNKTKEKLENILLNKHDKIFVAEIDSKVVGYIHANDYDVIYAPSMKNIMGIAVANEYKRQGIGALLIEQAESWAKSENVNIIRLVSGEKRTEAHNFYKKCGYGEGRKQLNFKKELR
ncbi:MAG: GNAT family N-acetyltransferase [Clostridia bacterium]|nr:GNAT family N-acetyltransferase [Clostridia bacterium]